MFDEDHLVCRIGPRRRHARSETPRPLASPLPDPVGHAVGAQAGAGTARAPGGRAHLDLSKPVAITLFATLHFARSAANPWPY